MTSAAAACAMAPCMGSKPVRPGPPCETVLLPSQMASGSFNGSGQGDARWAKRMYLAWTSDIPRMDLAGCLRRQAVYLTYVRGAASAPAVPGGSGGRRGGKRWRGTCEVYARYMAGR